MFFKDMRKIEFIQIPGYALWGLNLTGNELICYSLIYSFSQSQRGCFIGTQDEVAEILNISKRTASSLIASLEAKDLIEKSIIGIDDKKVSVLTAKVQNLQYGVQSADFSTQSAKIASPKVQKLQDAPILSTNSITYINNNIPPLCSPQGELPSKNKTKAQAQTHPPVPPTPLPWSEKVIEAWYELCKMPKWKNKPKSAIDKVIKKLSKYPEDVVLAAIEDAIMGNYQGIFPDKFAKAIKSQPPIPKQPRERVIDIKDIL